MKLEQAEKFAVFLKDWIELYCVRVEIAGSVRRLRPNCNDIDLVVIPKVNRSFDLLGASTDESMPLWDMLSSFITITSNARWRAGSEGWRNASNFFLDLPKCSLDIFLATPETWISVLICRTGSAAHNIKIAERAKAKGWKWNSLTGLHDGERILPVKTEEEFFTALDLPYLKPEHREAI